MSKFITGIVLGGVVSVAGIRYMNDRKPMKKSKKWVSCAQDRIDEWT